VPDRAHLAALDRLSSDAWLEAKALGNHWLGPEHLFLAILASQEERAASAALAACGLDHDGFAEALTMAFENADPQEDQPEQWRLESPRPNPAFYAVMGRAEGLAAGLGASGVSFEHALIACIWDPSTSVYQEELFGVTREEILAQLGRLGVQLPQAPLPPRPRPSGKRVFVPYDGLMSVVGELTTRLPKDSGIGFNHDGASRAWVSAYSEIDLEPYVAEVLDDLGLEPVRQPENA
jgi:hypothetical protein